MTNREITEIMIVATCCVGFLIITSGAIFLIATGALTPDLLGAVKTGGMGGGLVGLAYIPFNIFRAVIEQGKRK